MPRCRALEIENSVEKKSRAAFSFSGPASSETRERISRSRAGSVTDPPVTRLAIATSRATERRSRKSRTSSSSMRSIFSRAFFRSVVFSLISFASIKTKSPFSLRSGAFVSSDCPPSACAQAPRSCKRVKPKAVIARHLAVHVRYYTINPRRMRNPRLSFLVYSPLAVVMQ